MQERLPPRSSLVGPQCGNCRTENPAPGVDFHDEGGDDFLGDDYGQWYSLVMVDGAVNFNWWWQKWCWRHLAGQADNSTDAGTLSIVPKSPDCGYVAKEFLRQHQIRWSIGKRQQQGKLAPRQCGQVRSACKDNRSCFYCCYWQAWLLLWQFTSGKEYIGNSKFCAIPFKIFTAPSPVLVPVKYRALKKAMEVDVKLYLTGKHV